MSTSPQDTEITLGTGRMLALFFALVVVCALFFAVGFSLGRKAVNLGASNRSDQTQTPASVVRPSAGKNTPPSGSPSDTFNFYKAVEQKTADSQLASPPAAPSAPAKADAQAQPAAAAPPA